MRRALESSLTSLHGRVAPRLAAGVALVCLACPLTIRAQQPAPAPAPALDFSGVLFGNYSYRTDSAAKAAKGGPRTLSHTLSLTAGRHVDHMITRMAAEAVDADLIYYEDYPYAEQPERMTHVWGTNEWVSETIELSEDAMQARIARRSNAVAGRRYLLRSRAGAKRIMAGDDE